VRKEVIFVKNTQYKFLRVLCSLYDGKKEVPESDIREAWPSCPAHGAIMSLGKNVYFDYNEDHRYPKYRPLPQAFLLVQERKRSNLLLAVSLVTLAVAVLTLAATVILAVV